MLYKSYFWVYHTVLYYTNMSTTRDVISNFQRNLVGRVETACPAEAKELIYNEKWNGNYKLIFHNRTIRSASN